MTEATVLKTIQIVSTPGVLGGKPRIEGHRISVQHVAEHYAHAHWSVEEIAKSYKLTLAEIFAALAYYYQHQAEIDEAIRQDRAWADEITAEREAFAGTSEYLDAVMTPPAVAAEFDLSPRTVREAIEKGWIEALKSGGTWLIRRADAEKRWGGRKKK